MNTLGLDRVVLMSCLTITLNVKRDGSLCFLCVCWQVRRYAAGKAIKGEEDRPRKRAIPF